LNSIVAMHPIIPVLSSRIRYSSGPFQERKYAACFGT
ncbi:MAG: hypothetical protein ACI9NT_001125, partial [Bacteroidia bacterium]